MGLRWSALVGGCAALLFLLCASEAQAGSFWQQIKVLPYESTSMDSLAHPPQTLQAADSCARTPRSPELLPTELQSAKRPKATAQRPSAKKPSQQDSKTLSGKPE
ncbi:MAG: hypothetical protein H6508_08365 [Calditrichaeota bacterium]|nr:hypothetical protein [Calditrichota bacterium]